MNNSGSVTLPDDRILAYEIYGDEDGIPLVFHHGTPGSRILGALLSETAYEQGVRVIAPSRPGYGASDADPDRTLETWADDCAALVDHLSHQSFAVVGFSGGGPFALQVAKHLPNRVASVGLVSSLVPESDAGLFGTLARIPRLLGLTFRASGLMARYRGSEFVVRQLTDETVDEETATIVSRDFRTALERGPAGAVRESQFFTSDWSLPNPDTSVHVWHGIEDENVPIDPVREAYASLSDVSVSEIETDHLGALLAVTDAIVGLSKE